VNHLLESSQPGSIIAAGDEIDLQVLGNYVSHDHVGDRTMADMPAESKYAITGTRRLLKRKEKCKVKRENELR
jgi:hypothetical protein